MDQIYRENPSSSKIKSLVELFVSAEGFGRRYLFGRNEHSDVLAKIFNVDAFVDDFVEKGAIWKDKPVIHRASVPNNGIIVNCVMNARPIAAQKLINELKIAGSISYYDLQMQLPDLIPFPKFVIETQLDFAQNKEKWEKLENSLFDIESKEVLARILQYRCTGDFTFMKQFSSITVIPSSINKNFVSS